jgi:hypothetical protein
MVPALAWVLYRHSVWQPDAFDWRVLTDISRIRVHGGWLLAVILLIPVNWALETMKWQLFLRVFTRIPFSKALAAVLSGLVFSLFTPNRMGEYAGRMLLLPPNAIWGVTISSLLGSWSQWVILLLAGVPGVFVLSGVFLPDTPLSLRLGFLILGLGLALVLALGLFQLRLVVSFVRWLPGRKLRRRLWRQVILLHRYTPGDMAKAMLLAAVRYSVYCLQYYLLLRFFGIHPPLLTAVAGIAAIFLAQTSLPLPPLAGLMVRGELALSVWGYFSEDTVAMLASAYGLFILNLSLPSLLGAVMIIYHNFIKKNP